MPDDLQAPLPDTEEHFNETYFRKIEALFAALRGRGISLTPADYQLAEQWYDRGIPLSCVLRGIRTAYFKKLAEAESVEDEEVRSLAWCRWAVRQEWKEYRETAGAGTEQPREARGGDELEAVLDALVFDLDRAARLAAAAGRSTLVPEIESVGQAVAALAATRPADRPRPECLEKALEALDARLVSAAELNLEPDVLDKLKKKIDRRLKAHAAAMDEADAERTRRLALSAAVRRELELPLLTLHGL